MKKIILILVSLFATLWFYVSIKIERNKLHSDQVAQLKNQVYQLEQKIDSTQFFDMQGRCKRIIQNGVNCPSVDMVLYLDSLVQVHQQKKYTFDISDTIDMTACRQWIFN